ncbi:alpha/beta hydrolase [Bermanella marisrubri]|uniref:Lipoprotein, putative n=1 Tax=Bermanella marisrubri TaxID=207949 RepID=Q1N049_9GAMM|nr:alpha/beta hydrolase [Bermanella marisrubri]EAT11668.1 lipoprotein, putative [Oceanobacter sp. RED65] [Bermanella marisrubri]QIZ83295.1 alpha/beta hydrolase [Bermanella marisrubri]
MQRPLVVCLLLLLAGCGNLTSLMFYPSKKLPVMPDRLGNEYQEVWHQAADGTKLYSWWLPAHLKENEEAKGSIVFLHGNAQNISYHQLSVNWLPEQGYNVFLLGYRQFGKSEGLANLPNVYQDVHSGLSWVIEHGDSDRIFILGQSMGATLAVYGLASYEHKQEVDALVLDAAFHSYPEMAAHAMASNWLTWLLQLPAYSITDQYDPDQWINQRNDIPLMMLHSPDDQIVPYEFGRRLFEAADEPKTWLNSQEKHIASFNFKHVRKALLDYLESLSK